jgi:hypothetical protein
VKLDKYLTLIVLTAVASGFFSSYIHMPSSPVPFGNWGLKYSDIVYGVFYPRFLELGSARGRYWYSTAVIDELVEGRVLCPAPYVDYFFEYPPVVGVLWFLSTCAALTLTPRGGGVSYVEFISAVAEVHFLINAVVLVVSMTLTSVLIYRTLEGSPGLRRTYRALLYLILPSVLLYTTYNWDSLCSLLALSSLVVLDRGRGKWRFLVAGVLLGLSIATKLLTAPIALVLLVYLLNQSLRRDNCGKDYMHFLLGLLASGGIPYIVVLLVAPRAFLDFLTYHSTWYCENCIYSIVVHDIFSPIHRLAATATVLAFTLAVTVALLRRGFKGFSRRIYEVALCAVGSAVIFNYVSTPQMLLLLTPLALVTLNGTELVLYVLSDVLNASIMLAFFSDEAIRAALSSLGVPIEVKYSPWTPDSPVQWLAYARSTLLIALLIRKLIHLYTADLLPAMNGEGSCYCGEVRVASPLPEGSTPGRVSGLLPLPQTGLGVMGTPTIIAPGSQILNTHHQ